jgi:hypothetical protein
LIAAQRPKDHIVCNLKLGFTGERSGLTFARTLIARSWKT